MIELLYLIGALLYALFIFIFLRTKDYKTANLCNVLVVSTIFAFPSFYYIILGGTAYSAFSDAGLERYIFISIFVYLLCLIEISVRKYTLKTKGVVCLKLIERKLYYNFFLYASSALVICYIAYNANQLPMINIFLGNFTGIRPDTDGAVRFFFSYILVVSILVPILYFNVLEQKGRSVKIYMLGFCIAMLLAVGGNKGLLVYFLIFTLFTTSRKLNIKFLVLAATLLFFFYYIVMVATIEGLYPEADKSIGTMLGSALRRFFVTQGAGLIVTLDFCSVNDLYHFKFNKLENVIYSLVYGHSFAGSMPSHFLGNIACYTNIMYALAVLVFFYIVLFFVNIFSERLSSGRFVLSWAAFINTYYLGLGGATEAQFYRLSFTVLILFILFKLRREEQVV